MRLTGSTIAVTGGTGFLGRHLALGSGEEIAIGDLATVVAWYHRSP